MTPYSDSNFLAALYLETIFAGDAEECFRKARAEAAVVLPVTELLRVEVSNAFQRYVFLSRTGGSLRMTLETAAAASGFFEADLFLGSTLAIPEVSTAEVRKMAVDLSQRHTARHGFRAYDVLHVASALLLRCDTFWSYDHLARRLAQLEGLAVNPYPSG